MTLQTGSLLEMVAVLTVLAVVLTEMARQAATSKRKASPPSSEDTAEGQNPNEVSPRAGSSTTPDAP